MVSRGRYLSSGEVEAVKVMVPPVHPTLHLMRSGKVSCRKQRQLWKSKDCVIVIQVSECV